jgi:hypothetical protein
MSPQSLLGPTGIRRETVRFPGYCPDNLSALAPFLRQSPSVSGGPFASRDGHSPDPPEHRGVAAGLLQGGRSVGYVIAAFVYQICLSAGLTTDHRHAVGSKAENGVVAFIVSKQSVPKLK